MYGIVTQGKDGSDAALLHLISKHSSFPRSTGHSPLSVAMKTAVYLLSRTYGDSRSRGAEVLTVPLTGFTLNQPAGSRRTEYLREKVAAGS